MEGVAGGGARSDPEAAQHQRQLILHGIDSPSLCPRIGRTSVRFIETLQRGAFINLESTKRSIREAFTPAAEANGPMDSD